MKILIYYFYMVRMWYLVSNVEIVRRYLSKYNLENNILVTDKDSSTVASAAQAFDTEEKRIAKSMSFWINDVPTLIVCAGDTKIDNSKYKSVFGTKAKMIEAEKVLEVIGHPVGGVCPFATKEGVEIYLDESLKRFATVFPACGSANSAIEISIKELEEATDYIKWVDVCKMREEV